MHAARRASRPRVGFSWGAFCRFAPHRLRALDFSLFISAPHARRSARKSAARRILLGSLLSLRSTPLESARFLLVHFCSSCTPLGAQVGRASDSPGEPFVASLHTA